MSETNGDSLSFRADRWAGIYIVFGILGFVFLAMMVGDRGPHSPFAVAVMFVVLGILRYSSFYVRLNPDFFETKLAPIAGWNSVLYSEVVSVEVDSSIMMIHFRRHDAPQDSEPKRIKVRLGEMRETERERLISAFQAKLPNIEIARLE
jgi:hypothetical protein